MDELPAFLAATLGDALALELTLLVGFVLVLNIRRMLHTSLRRLDRDRD